MLEGVADSLRDYLVLADCIGHLCPLFATLAKALEVDRRPAHRAALTSTLFIPGLHAPVAEHMVAAQGAAGVVTVADSALHLFYG